MCAASEAAQAHAVESFAKIATSDFRRCSPVSENAHLGALNGVRRHLSASSFKQVLARGPGSRSRAPSFVDVHGHANKTDNSRVIVLNKSNIT
jgi:hypothetical protein